MGRGLSRRDFVKLAGAGGAALASGQLVWPSSASAVVYPRTAWTPAGTLVRRSGGGAINQVLWTTIMRVDTKLANPVDGFYLWFWTHDAPICRLYTAPAVTGPYTEYVIPGRDGINVPAPPAGWAPSHFSSGDVVWDPVDQAFYSSPHGAFTGYQNTVIIRSVDGINWTYVVEGAIVPNGAPGAFDNFHVGYGRFLRDYDGNVVRLGGKLHWYYRGERHTRIYRLGLATSPDWVTWTKHSAAPLFDPLNGALFGTGSALSVGDSKVYLYMSTADGLAPFTMYQKVSDTPSATDWSDGPGLPVYQDANVISDGGSYIIVNGIHYLVYSSTDTLAGEVRLLRSPVPTGTIP